MRMIRAFALAVFLCVIAVRLSAQEARPTQDQRATVAGLMRQLASCEFQLGSATNVTADVVEGKLYVDWATVKHEIETANPEMVFDLATRKLTTQPSPDHQK